MNFILKALSGAAGPYVAGTVGAVVLALAGGLWLQSTRLDHAKHDLSKARAALYVPDAAGKPTHQTWQAKAEAAESAIARQNTEIEKAGQISAHKLALSEKAVSDARAVAESYRKSAAQIRAYQPKGSTSCERTGDVLQLIRGAQ